MSQKAFVYTELPVSIPFASVPWTDVNASIKKQPGFLNKTWLAGLGNTSAGGFYAFATIADAQHFVTEYFPPQARSFGAPQTTRIFDAEVVLDASRDMNSVHFGGKIGTAPAAFVYTEAQVSIPFEQLPWRDINPDLRAQRGLLCKTWLSGLHTNSAGGLYGFDTIDNAKAYAIDYFPSLAKALNAAYTTRIFEAAPTVEASRAMQSPFFA
jgi:putative monooxygenase ydhR